MTEILELKLIEIFCCADDFCKEFEKEIEQKLMPKGKDLDWLVLWLEIAFDH